MSESGVYLTAAECASWCGGVWNGAPDAVFCGVQTDTRMSMEGKLFVAIKGERFDGHDFVHDAAAAGAAGALVSGVRRYENVPTITVGGDTRDALAKIARGWRRKCHAVIVGITGSAGKTTTKEILAHLLSSGLKAEVCRTSDNWNNDVGLPKSILQMTSGSDFGVFEAGTNHPGEMERLARIMCPDCAVITNIGRAHAEFFPTLQDTAREKASLLAAVPKDGFVVLDADSVFFSYLSGFAKCRVVSVSINGSNADFSVEKVDPASGGMTVRLKCGGTLELRTGLAGLHQCSDALAAVAAAVELGVPLDMFNPAFSTFRGLAGRWQTLRREGVLWINDAYNANPDSMKASLRAFTGISAKRRIAVLGDMLELGSGEEAFHRAVGSEAASCRIDVLIAVGERACSWIAAAAGEGGVPAVLRAPSANCASEILSSMISSGDAVLVKGSNGMHLSEICPE